MFLTTRALGEPARDGASLERRMNRLVNEALGGLDWQHRESPATSWVPPVDILEEADAIRIIAEVPGVKPDRVKISLENNVLTIRGDKEQAAEERSERVHRYERTYGTFERSFTLPSSVNLSAIQATYENGVLTVRLPKAEEAKPRQIEVKVVSK
jgi:HSP20 family protein